MAGLASLGGAGIYFGKVHDDRLGEAFVAARTIKVRSRPAPVSIRNSAGPFCDTFSGVRARVLESVCEGFGV